MKPSNVARNGPGGSMGEALDPSGTAIATRRATRASTGGTTSSWAWNESFRPDLWFAGAVAGAVLGERASSAVVSALSVRTNRQRGRRFRITSMDDAIARVAL